MGDWPRPIRGEHEEFERGALLEVVTNSVRHGPNHDSRIELRVWAGGGRLRVEVADEGPGIEAVPSGPRQDSESHWGLHLVDSLADRWGPKREPEALVWFELDGKSPGRGLSRVQPGRPASTAAIEPLTVGGPGPGEGRAR